MTFPYDATDINQARVQIFGNCKFLPDLAGTFPIGRYDNLALIANGIN
jgi:hypothetical protein